MEHLSSLLIVAACLVLFLTGPSKVEARCQQLNGWTPSYPDPADFSQHPLQAVEDNWIMCNFKDAHGNQYGLGSYQIRSDVVGSVASAFSALNAVAPAAIQGILDCGCQPGPCLANAVLDLAYSVNATANQLIASGSAEGAVLAHQVPAILAEYATLLTGPYNTANLPQAVIDITVAVIPHVNPNAHYHFDGSYPLSQVDMTVYQRPGVPARLNGLTFAYNEDATNLHRFSLSWSALDFVTSSPISGFLQLQDKYGPLLWGQNNTGYEIAKLSDGNLDHWTQSDQPWMAAEGVFNAALTSTKVKGVCWNSRQWHTSPSLSLSQTGPYVWTPFVTSSGIAVQLATYYTNASYLTQGSLGGGNIVFPVCHGEEGFNPASKYVVEIDGSLCHPGPMQAIHNGTFSFTLSNPWTSTHGTGNTYWQTVHILSDVWKLNLVVQALVPDNEIGWVNNPKGAFSEAPSTVTGTINGKEIESIFASIEHLKTG